MPGPAQDPEATMRLLFYARLMKFRGGYYDDIDLDVDRLMEDVYRAISVDTPEQRREARREYQRAWNVKQKEKRRLLKAVQSLRKEQRNIPAHP